MMSASSTAASYEADLAASPASSAQQHPTLASLGLTLGSFDPLDKHAHSTQRLPRACTSQEVSVETILSSVRAAAQSAQPVALLAHVGSQHGVIARSTIGHESHASLAHALNTHALPALAAVYGGLDRFAQAFVQLKPVEHVLKAQRRKLRAEGAREVVRSITAHLDLASVLAWAGSLQSLADYERTRRLETHDFSFVGGHLRVEASRLHVGHGLAGPKKPVRAHVRQLLDLLHLDLGVETVRLPKSERSFDGEGVSRSRSLRALLHGHAQFLLDPGAFRPGLPMVLHLYYRFSADGGKMGRVSISKRPLFVDLVSILADPDVFWPHAATTVSSPLLLTLAAENDTIEGVCAQASKRANALLELVDPIVIRDEDGTVAHEIVLKIESGNYLSNSQMRCFLSSTSQSSYSDLEFSLANSSATLKTLAVNAFDRSSDDDTNGFVRTDVFLTDLPLPCTGRSLYEYLSARQLWSLMPEPEGLHTVINQSAALCQKLLEMLPTAAVNALDAQLLTETGFALDPKPRAGWQWRQMWSAQLAFDVHLKDYAKLLLLVRSFARIIVAIYAPASYRTARTLLRLAVDSFTFAALWRDVCSNPQLAVHFIWPHLMFAFRDMPLSMLLSESTEAVFRVFRRIEQHASFHADNHVTELMQRYLAYSAVRQAERGLRHAPSIELSAEHCEACVAGKHTRTILDPALVGDPLPLFRALDMLGFDRAVVTKQHDDGRVEILDAHADHVPSAPVLPTLSELAEQRERAEKQRVTDLFGDVDDGKTPSAAAPAKPEKKQRVPAPSGKTKHGHAAGPSERAAKTESASEKESKAHRHAHGDRDKDRGKGKEEKEDKKARSDDGSDDPRPPEVPLSADDYLDDEEFERVFGNEQQQRAEEEEERAHALQYDAEDKEWKPRYRSNVCSGCGRSKKHKHQQQRVAKQRSASSDSKMNVDED